MISIKSNSYANLIYTTSFLTSVMLISYAYLVWLEINAINGILETINICILSLVLLRTLQKKIDLFEPAPWIAAGFCVVYVVRPIILEKYNFYQYEELTIPLLISSISIFLFFLGYYLSQRIYLKYKKDNSEKQRVPKNITTTAVIAFIFGILYHFYLFIKEFGVNFLTQINYVTLTKLFEQDTSEVSNIIRAFLSSLMVALPLILFYNSIINNSRLRIKILYGVFIAVILMILLLLIQNRRTMLGVLVAMAYIYHRWVKKLPAGKVAISSLLLIPAMFIWGLLRGISLGVGDMITNLKQVIGNAYENIIFSLIHYYEISMFDGLVNIYNGIYRFSNLDIRYGADYWKILTIIIPRSVWSDKPVFSGTKYVEIFFPEWNANTGGAFTVSIVGELIWNVGILGVFGMLIYGFAFGILGKLSTRFNLLLSLCYGVSFFSLVFAFVRGGHHLMILEALLKVVAFLVIFNISNVNFTLRKQLKDSLIKP